MQKVSIPLHIALRLSGAISHIVDEATETHTRVLA